MLGFTTPAIGPTPPVSWLVASGICPSSTSVERLGGRARRRPRATAREPSAARIGGHMRAGSIGGPACVTPPPAWWAEISEAGTTSTTSGRAAASRATASASVCSAAFMGGDAKSGAVALQSDRRSQPWRRALDRRYEEASQRRSRSLGPMGLYDPAYEHDSLWRRLPRPARRRSPRTRRSRARSRRSTISSTAAPRARTPRPATARASWRRSRTRSCARAGLRAAAGGRATPWRSACCRARPTGARRPRP